MNAAYLLLGSNMENPLQQLAMAAEHIDTSIGKVKKRSSHYRTAAWGNQAQPDFINMALLCETPLAAEELMERILLIESEMGRRRTVKNAPRIIDIDILFFNADIHAEKSLQIPHPAFPDRRFAIIPMVEIAADLTHPESGLSMTQLLARCQDTLAVDKI